MIVHLSDGTADAQVDDQKWHWWMTALDQARRVPTRWPAPPATATDDPRTARLRLAADPGSAKAARDFAGTELPGWCAGDLVEDIGVVISELVTNALRHGLTGVRQVSALPLQLVLVGHGRRVLVVVTDPSGRTPVLAATGELAEAGRGLQIVAGLSSSWGCTPLVSGGKAVWAIFQRPTG
ncbi:MAG TPA: ATP-binding protein [Streptosporangiaceae bacterium]|nr:ATP-binding protein [Streptosporangiaceae bacterium]